jgi:glycosyltransferase involved in cell wall biosynthesis
MSRRVYFAIPGDLNAPTGGYAYARHMLALLPQKGVRIEPLMLAGTFPFPDEKALRTTQEALCAVSQNEVLLIDGLAYGALPADILNTVKAPIIALVHHPLYLEAGLTAEQQATLYESEKAALRLAQHVIVTSPLTARIIAADFGVPEHVITIAVPGTLPAPRAQGTGDPLQLLAIGAVSPRKGYDILIKALEPLKAFNWHLTIIGSLTHVPPAVEALRELIIATGLEARVTLAGAVSDERMSETFAAADLFVSASLFEGYGMVLTEALARGLPIIASTGGAAADTVPEGVGFKVPSGDVKALSNALRTMLEKPDLRLSFGEKSWQAGQNLPRWQNTADIIAGVLAGVLKRMTA